ncbi:N(6)-adenosine-methyltransferase catalytic subunit METTL3-like isoform X2 [Amphiura filiformis]|uniref:N(6)-adenosine-methyltransferase catalytic subunit METTL3-like isoform X1 n=1 Tax=Amphiura filiformis TaxID=82378 RepID=UPI003B225196
MSDTWNEIQAVKRRQESLRERMQRRKKERQNLEIELGGGGAQTTSSSTSTTVTDVTTTSAAATSAPSGPPSRSSSPAPPAPSTAAASAPVPEPIIDDPQVEPKLLQCLCYEATELNLPVNSIHLKDNVSKALKKPVGQVQIETLLQKFAAQALIGIKYDNSGEGHQSALLVTSADINKIEALTGKSETKISTDVMARKRKRSGSPAVEEKQPEKKVLQTDNQRQESQKTQKSQPDKNPEEDDLLQSLLESTSFKEQESKAAGKEIFELLSMPTAKEQSLAEKFKSEGGTVQEFCPHGTRDECAKITGIDNCDKLHFRRIINKHTDESLGDCSFLNTCFHMDTCKYVHYDVERSRGDAKTDSSALVKKGLMGEVTMIPPQWIQCDIRHIDSNILGKFAVIMADPPWDIHMELPYGTMQDDEMRKMNVPLLQDEGFIFLWVTGRAMELGRECLELWGYKRCEELIWVKTNQLQRLIRTGRTGHWLNHGKEHCLIGVKGQPKGYNKGLDCDVIVAEVRETSHKPDEVYGLIERLSPGTRKVELFGRMHNVQPNWVTLGNQLDGIHIVEPDMIERFKVVYPDMNPVHLLKPLQKK